MGVRIREVDVVLGELFLGVLSNALYERSKEIFTGTPGRKAIGATAKDYPEIKLVEDALTRWCKSEEFAAQLEAMQAGLDGKTDEALVESFVDVGLFHDCLHNTHESARRVLETFAKYLRRETYRTEDALLIESNRADLRQRETREGLGTVNALLKGLHETSDRQTSSVGDLRDEMRAGFESLLEERAPAAIKAHEYPDAEPYLPRKVCETKDAGPYSLYLLRGDKLLELTEVVARRKGVVLLCDAGVGKSTELQHVAAHYSKEGYRFHVEKVSLNHYVDQSVPALLDPHWPQVSEDELLIIFDGFDEIESANRMNAVRRIESFAEDHPDVHIVISCRTNFYNRETDNFSGTLKGFTSYTLLDLQEEVIENYLSAELGTRKRAFEQGIRDNQLYGLLRSPFYLTRLVGLFLESGSMPRTKAGVFEELVQHSLRFDAEHFRTTGDLPEKRRRIIDALETLALSMEMFGRNYLGDDEYHQIIRDERTREILRHCALWERDKQGKGTWEFDHNNFQEYLAARSLSRQPLTVIKSFISFEPDYAKINPTWLNTLAFLVSILDPAGQKFRELLGWIEQVEPEVIIKFEPDKIPTPTRVAYFKSVFQKAKGVGLGIDRDRFNYNDLARFGRSNDTVLFLLDEIENAAATETLATALELLRYFSIPPSHRRRAVDILAGRATDPDLDSDVRYLALATLADTGLNRKAVIERVLPVLRTADDAQVRHGLHYLVLSSNHLEDYIEVFLDSIERAGGVGRAVSESLSLKDGLKRAKTPAAVKQVLSHLKENFRSWDQAHLKDHLSVVVKNAAAVYQDEPVILDLMLGVISTLLRKHETKEAAVISAFLDVTGTRPEAFRRVFNSRDDYDGGDQGAWSNLLAFIADEACFHYFAQQYAENRLTDREVWSFQNNVGFLRGGNDFKTFNELINEKSGGKFILTPGRDYNEERRQAHGRDFHLLFDRNAFSASLLSLFEGKGRDVLTSKDILDLHMVNSQEGPKYSNQALQALHELAERNGGRVSRDLADKLVGEYWEGYSIWEIYEYLEQNEELTPTPEQRAHIVGWCEAKLHSVNFRTAITVNQNRSWTVDPVATCLRFFQRRFDLAYPEDVMLDMISFESSDASGSEGLAFYEGRLDETAMTERIMENLAEGIDQDDVLKNHLDYCRRHDVEEVIPFALRMVVGPGGDSFRRHVALETVCAFPDARENLEQALPQIADSFKWGVVQKLTTLGSEICADFLREILARGDEGEQLRAAKYLMEAQDLEALAYYVGHVEETRQYHFGFTDASPFRNFRSAEALPLFFRLLKLSYDERFNQGDVNYLQNSVLEALNQMALESRQNYQLVRDALSDFIGENEAEIEGVKYLRRYISRLERLYYTSIGQRFTLDDVVTKLRVITSGAPAAGRTLMTEDIA